MATLRVELLTDPSDQRRLQSLLQEHHYLGTIKPVGERMLYAALDPSGRWLAVLVFSAAAKHLKARDQWIGWTRSQRDRRLSLVANNSRFLILPAVKRDRAFIVTQNPRIMNRWVADAPRPPKNRPAFAASTSLTL